MPYAISFSKFGTKRSQVQILSPRLTFPDDFSSLPVEISIELAPVVGAGTMRPAPSNCKARRLVGPLYFLIGGGDSPKVKMPPLSFCSVRFFFLKGRNDKNNCTFSIANSLLS